MTGITWYDEDKRVILQRFTGKTTWRDLQVIAQLSASMLNSVDHPVQLIIDRTHAAFFVLEASEMKSLEKMVPANQDLVIVVGSEAYVRQLGETLGTWVAPRAFRGSYYVNTMAEAHRILQRERGIELPVSDDFDDSAAVVHQVDNACQTYPQTPTQSSHYTTAHPVNNDT